MVGPPFSFGAGGRPFLLPPMEGTMGATTILVIVLAVVVFGGMGAMLIYINTEPKKGSKEGPKKEK